MLRQLKRHRIPPVLRVCGSRLLISQERDGYFASAASTPPDSRGDFQTRLGGTAGLASSKVKRQLTRGLVRPELHVLRQPMRGTFPNGEGVVALA